MREDGDNIDRVFPQLAAAAYREFKQKYSGNPDIREWNVGLPEHFVEKGGRWWAVAQATAKALYDAAPTEAQRVTLYSSILRRSGSAPEAMKILKATGERFRNDRAFLFDWGNVAGATGDYGLDCWLAARSICDGPALSARQCKLSLSGLSAAFRELFASSGDLSFAAGRAACGQLGLRLPELDAKARDIFEKDVAEGRNNGVADLASEKAIDAIRRAVILGANEVEPDNNPVFFEKLLGEPDSYRYTALLSMVGGTKVPPAL